MNFFTLQFLLCSGDFYIQNCNGTSTISNDEELEYDKLHYSNLKNFFENFISISRKPHSHLNLNQSRRILNIIGMYPSEYGKTLIIPFLKNLISSKRENGICDKVFGHPFPILKRTKNFPKRPIPFREEISLNRILKVYRSMNVFHSYSFTAIFYNIKNNELLYSISLMCLVENMGIIYLRILSEVSYYKTDLLFIRDFVTHSAAFLHCVNVIYNIALKNNLVMNAFRIFAVKNLKLFFIFKHIWKLSYELILERKDNIFRKLVSFYFPSKVEHVNQFRNGGIVLNEFNSEISMLFEFITKIELNLNFKRGFELLKITKKYDYENTENFITDFDKEGLLKFYTEKYENYTFVSNQRRIKDPAYFLNSLGTEYSVKTSFLDDVKGVSLLFIKNEDIKRYFFTMQDIAYSNNDFKHINDTSTTQQSYKAGDVQPEKKQRLESELPSMQHSSTNHEQINNDNPINCVSTSVENLGDSNISCTHIDSYIRPEWTLYDQEFVNF